MERRKKWIIILFMLFAAVGSGAYKYLISRTQVLTLDQLMWHLSCNRQETIKKPMTYREEDYKKELEKNDFSEEVLELLLTKGSLTAVTKEEAIEDTTVLFRVLSESYGGYIYFGGKTQFDKARENIIERIKSLPQSKVPAEKLELILREELSFIVDTHFFIDGKSTCFKEAYCYYGSGIGEIAKDNGGYYIVEEGKKYHIEESWGQYIHPTIGKTGQLVYGLFAIADEEEKEKLPASVTLHRGFKRKQKDLVWKACKVGQSKAEQEDSNYAYEERGEIPVVSLRQMDYGLEANAFIEEGKKLRGVPAAVLDLRGNTGGSSYINMMWLYQVTGALVYPKQTELLYDSEIRKYIGKKAASDPMKKGKLVFDMDASNPNVYKAVDQYIADEDKWGSIHYEKGASWVPNDTIWFVLVDKSVYSSGEIFLRQLETMDHVVLVGTNSNGCLLIGNPNYYAPIYLPHSKISLIYGDSVILADDMEGYDARGTLPDVYIADEDALDAVIRCYKHAVSSKARAKY